MNRKISRKKKRKYSKEEKLAHNLKDFQFSLFNVSVITEK